MMRFLGLALLALCLTACSSSTTSLPAPGSIAELTRDNFDKLVHKGGPPALIDFWSEDCPPCAVMHPILKEWANKNPSVLVGRVDYYAQAPLTMRYDVDKLPGFLLFVDGVCVARLYGIQTHAAFDKLLLDHAGDQ